MGEQITPIGPQVPNTAEPMPVQLTRMEGTINLIAYQFSEVKDDIKELRAESKGHGDAISALQLARAQSNGASVSWHTWLPILAALASVVLFAIEMLR